VKANCGPYVLSGRFGALLYNSSKKELCIWKFSTKEKRTDLVLSIKIIKIESAAKWPDIAGSLKMPDGKL